MRLSFPDQFDDAKFLMLAASDENDGLPVKILLCTKIKATQNHQVEYNDCFFSYLISGFHSMPQLKVASALPTSFAGLT